MFKKFIGGSLLIFSGQLSGKILAMLNSIILARYLHAHDYGLFLLGISIFQFFRIPSSLGIPSILPKSIAEYQGKKLFHKIESIFAVSLCNCISLAVFFAIVLFTLAPYISNNIFHSSRLQEILRTLSYLLPVAVIIPIILSVYRGYKITRTKIIFENILPHFLRIICFLLLFSLGLKLSAAYFAFIISSIFILIFIKIDMAKTLNITLKTERYEYKLSTALLKLSWPLIIQDFVWIIYINIDRFSIGYYLDSQELGIYGAASAIAGLLLMIPQSFSFLSLPVFTKYIANNAMREFKTSYNSIATTMFVLSLPIFICLIFLSKDVLILLFGIEYSSGATALLIIAIGILSKCIIGPAPEALIGAGKTKAPLISLTIGCGINIIFNIILIPKFGINGAAFATCIGMLVSRTIIACLNYKYLQVLPINKYHLIWTLICTFIVSIFLLLKMVPMGPPSINNYLKGITYLLANYSILLVILKFSNFGKNWLSKVIGTGLQ